MTLQYMYAGLIFNVLHVCASRKVSKHVPVKCSAFVSINHFSKCPESPVQPPQECSSCSQGGFAGYELLLEDPVNTFECLDH